MAEQQVSSLELSPIDIKLRSHPAVIVLLWSIAALPVIYFLAMVEWSAVTFPYWDHIRFAEFLISWHDGTFHLGDLFKPLVQSRPAVPWAVLLLTAIATDWNIKIEFIYLTASLIVGFGFLVWGLRQISAEPVVTAAAAALLSIVWFSPGASMNHWFSAMVLETFALMFATAALMIIAARPWSWPANIMAAVLAWLATYSLSNGLFLFPAIALTHQLAGRRPFVPNRFSLFWSANAALIFWLYVPGLQITKTGTLLETIQFVVVYLGGPLATLLWYPYAQTGGLQPAEAVIRTWPAFVVGIVVLSIACAAALHGFRHLRAQDRAAFTLFSFLAFAFGCAIVTAYGRSIFGVSAALATRYSALSAFMLYGLVLYCVGRIGLRTPGLWLAVPFVMILQPSVVTYVRAINAYRAIHIFKIVAVDAWSPDGSETQWDQIVFPVSGAAQFKNARASLLRLHLGPYRR
ncbi:hypothetical protein [Bradyrhizobium sp. SZCCHNS1054]|uniref:hypothetical protein n=1 Tax=Bradyrhizobium sp. SZCCHNS1054 TaxID=3057301 RepID=UPI0029161DF8|nr:hypothetical protein [Bradyrhizobium sp. SZCCHNS1054]